MVAPATVFQFRDFPRERYGPGESVTALSTATAEVAQRPMARAGDFLLTHSSGVYGQLIRFGERIRYRGAEKIFAHWSHAAIFVNDNGDIIEALGGGVQKRNISVYHNTEYVVVHLPRITAQADRDQAIAFAEYCLAEPYGWLTIVSIALTLLFGAKLNFGVDGQQICSALVARCLERIGTIFTENEPWQLMPADLAEHFHVTQIGEQGKVPPMTEGLITASKPGKRRR
ncbi:MAG TPA: hypothetical protein VJO35_14480 [Terriglobales bacterium]|nr:hypothetical protein [Terriglobales bacterium]